MKIEVEKRHSIGQVADELKIPAHVIRFWEKNFPQIKPIIGKGSRRYYLQKDIDIIKNIQKLLHEDGYTIKGLQKHFAQKKTHSNENVKVIKNIENITTELKTIIKEL